MNLADYLRADAVSIRNDISSKKRALEEISRQLTKSSEFVSEKDVFTSLVAREKLGSTGLGNGVSIPHGRINGPDQPIGAFIRLTQGVDYDANDGQPVDLVFGLIVPKDASNEHLQILAGIAEVFQDDDRVAAIRACDDPAELHRLLTRANGG